MSIAMEAVVEGSPPRKRRTKSRRTKDITGGCNPHEAADLSDRKEEDYASTELITKDDTEKPKDEHDLYIEDENEKSNDNQGKSKRKRKRTRNKAVKGAVFDSQDNDSSFVSKLPTLQLVYRGEDLNEKTSNALQYVKQYHIDRANWKFNKAKQEYLIRHMLTPPSDFSSSSSTMNKDTYTNTGDEGAKKEEREENNDEKEEHVATPDQYWPDEWNECIARYFITIEGQAKQRLIETLKKTASQDIAPILNTTVKGLTSEGLPLQKKSASFGDFAMTQEDRTDLTGVSAAEHHRRHFQKERAMTLLAFMNI